MRKKTFLYFLFTNTLFLLNLLYPILCCKQNCKKTFYLLFQIKHILFVNTCTTYHVQQKLDQRFFHTKKILVSSKSLVFTPTVQSLDCNQTTLVIPFDLFQRASVLLISIHELNCIKFRLVKSSS